MAQWLDSSMCVMQQGARYVMEWWQLMDQQQFGIRGLIDLRLIEIGIGCLRNGGNVVG